MSVQLQFTNNFYIYLASLMLSNGNSHGTSSTEGDQTTINMFGNWVKTQGISQTTFSTQNNYNAVGFGKFNYMNFVVGSGTRPFSADDYNLQSKITSGLSISFSGVHFVDAESNNAVLEFTIAVTNTTSSTISINEIGIEKRFVQEGTFLYARGVLSTPLDIGANSSKTLTAQLTMPIATPSV